MLVHLLPFVALFCLSVRCLLIIPFSRPEHGRACDDWDSGWKMDD